MSFFNIRFDKDLSPEEYAQSIDNPAKRKAVESLFVDANKIIEHIRSTNNILVDKPIIQVDPSKEFVAEGMFGLIKISDGFINDCLTYETAPLRDLISDLPTDLDIPSIVQNVLFVWTIAHEYFHGIRQHNSVSEMQPGNLQASRATEVDADNCALASLYRVVQSELQEKLTDIMIRKVVFASLFWVLRSLPQNNSSQTHPQNLERIFHLNVKITHLRANINDHPDTSLITPESQGNIAPLRDFMARSELLYKLKYPDSSGDMIKFAMDFIKNEGWLDFTEKWEEIRHPISIKSGTKA